MSDKVECPACGAQDADLEHLRIELSAMKNSRDETSAALLDMARRGAERTQDALLSAAVLVLGACNWTVFPAIRSRGESMGVEPTERMEEAHRVSALRFVLKSGALARRAAR